ncbi:TetR/AcrR family transcriptional regulator [Paenibacillus agricola]|uniref:TetR/AcrR family transcriptional regulator n=1 Tax=Paenibacillus agricola TaxID=2716264 RepID=A0ABX0JA20_9BACL|nr:TetR/AcrR family transcriptional regulator [Paenibacillus agricola]NHN33002.1 TetR/AcrR family transcriptional regulator [Paenibacillus agricola]
MTANKIKTAALRLFAQNGYDSAPLSEIAKEVGIKTPSLYAHFSSKEDLFRAVFEDVLKEHEHRVEALIEEITGRSIHDKLFSIWQDACRTYLVSELHMTFIKRAMLFPPAAMQEELRTRFTDSEITLSAALVDIFTEGMDAGIIRQENTRDMLASYYCLLDGAFIQQFYYTHDDFEQRMQGVWRMYWFGITSLHK